MHNITTDLGSGIIEVEASGFWTLEHVENFLRDLEREARRVLATGKRHMLLCDFTRAAIQPQEVIAMLQRVAVTMPPEVPQGGALYRGEACAVAGEADRLGARRYGGVRRPRDGAGVDAGGLVGQPTLDAYITCPPKLRHTDRSRNQSYEGRPS
ncbi:hypothetical protein NHF48_019975 [Sphingomonas sp. H160509]|uniref:hypothetical protein n=1 Tax=Sphingomonas sp. H160509 TaxID=2955313 RepID=UPI0020979A9F|nr:hypothetical protein [Sphingomonas sp. H160509]MDD1452696.1 hypothetical protein [Sphingomonas sp. H160509]